MPSSKSTIPPQSLPLDTFHCSVWPAFWSHPPNWPNGGGIDTFEGVNLQQCNQMGLHTNASCMQVNLNQTANSTFITNTDCSYIAENNPVCTVIDPDIQSYGEAFTKAGSRVSVTECAESGISYDGSTRFGSQAEVPSFISSNSSIIDTSALGMPTANWPTGDCDMNTFSAPQNIILDITLCGDFVRQPEIFLQPFTGYIITTAYVVGNGSVYSQAYLEMGFMRVFKQIKNEYDC